MDLLITISWIKIFGLKRSKKHFSKSCETFAFKYIFIILDTIELLSILRHKLVFPCADPEVGGGGKRPPPLLKNQKAIGFLSNTCPDPRKNHKASMPAFNVGHHQSASETMAGR